jgi:hypothetical protein
MLRIETQDNDVNDWGIRAGWLKAGVVVSDWDGIPGSGDEITTGIQQASIIHGAGNNVCTTLYEYVRPGQAAATFNNYDLDASTLTARVRYYPPSANYDPQANTGGFVGVASNSSTWNGGTISTRGGDSYANPEPGWWRIVTCTDNATVQNEFIQEGQTDQASYLYQPVTPALDLSVAPGTATVLAGSGLTFTAIYTNTSSGITAGAAVSPTFTVTLPSELTFVSCGGAATSCTQVGNTLTITVNTIAAGLSGTVTINTTASATASGLVGLSVRADYRDVLGNPYVGSAGALVRMTP